MISPGEIFFTLLFAVVFLIIILKSPFFKKFIIRPKWIAWIFLFKVLTGITYGLIHYYQYNGGDTFAYFKDAEIIRQSLPGQPCLFIQLTLSVNTRPPAANIADYASAMSYWNDSGSYLLVRFHAIAGLITFHHYYANVVIYNFLTLAGMLYLFLFFYRFIPEKKSWIIALLFFFPSVTFWASGVHKDGISIAALGLILYFTGSIAEKNSNNSANAHTVAFWQKVVGLVLGIVMLWVVRNYLLMLLLPCVLGFIWVSHFPRRSVLKFLIVVVAFYLTTFQLKWINPNWDLFSLMARQQKEFASYSGNTNVPMPALDTNVSTIFLLIPTAIFHCLFLPLPWEVSSIVQWSSAMDNIVVVFLVLFSFAYFKKDILKTNPFFLFCLFFALSVFIFAGTIVPNIGALVRYKMPGILFLVAGCLSVIKFQWNPAKK